MAYKMKNQDLASECRAAGAGSSIAKFLRRKPKASYKSGVPIVEGTKAARQAEREERRDLRKSLREERKQLKRMGGDLEKQKKFKADKAAYEAKKNSPANFNEDKKAAREERRAIRKAHKAEQKEHKKNLREAKRAALKGEKAKYKQAKKEIKSYTDY